jgi:hypothetical protein
MEFMVVHEQYILAVSSKTNAKHISIRQFTFKSNKENVIEILSLLLLACLVLQRM